MDEARGADAVFITHPHPDHFSDTDAFSDRPVYVSARGVAIAGRNGMNTDRMRVLAAGETVRTGGLCVTAYRGRHCSFDMPTVSRVLFSPHTWLHIGKTMRLLGEAKRFSILPEDVFVFSVTDGEKTAVILGSAGMAKEEDYPQNADLLVFPLLIREKGSGNRDIIVRSLSRYNLSPSDFLSVIEINDIQAIKAMISQGLGIGFLYHSAVKDDLAAGKLKEIPLEDFDEYHEFTFIWGDDEIKKATLLSCRPLSHIRFRWADDKSGKTFFEIRLKESELTGEQVLEITDFATDEDKDDLVELWDSEVETLRRISGV